MFILIESFLKFLLNIFIKYLFYNNI